MKEPKHCGEDLLDCTKNPGENGRNLCATETEGFTACENGDVLGRSSCFCAVECDSVITRSEDAKTCSVKPDQADTAMMWKKESCGSGKVPCAEGDTCRYDTDNECKESDDSEKQAKCKCMTCVMHAAVFPGNGQWVPGYQTCGTPARKRLARHLPEERRRGNMVQ